MSLLFALAVAVSLRAAQPTVASAPVPAPLRTTISQADVQPIVDELGPDLVPKPLAAIRPSEFHAVWADWVARRERAVRARLERGDEDSIVNFLLFGITFTKTPRSTEHDVFSGAAGSSDRIVRRIDDLVAAVASPGANERLRVARRIIEGRGLDPTTAAGREAVRRFLVGALNRLLADYKEYFDGVAAGGSALLNQEGLSSDTSIFTSFAVDEALQAIKSERLVPAASVRRVAIIGPGLEFTDRREGYDFYPQQTIQPFAVIESLLRLGLAAAAELRVTAFDLNPRVHRHLEAARQQAAVGQGYILHLPRDRGQWWHPALVAYWDRFGDMVGARAQPVALPSGLAAVDVRAVLVRPPVVLSVTPLELDIVVHRLAPLPDGEQFDLVIATDVLISYDVFEQSLAAANIARMLRPGGILLSNNFIFELAATPLKAVGSTRVIYTDRLNSTDGVVWYRRQ
jgi:SAM-dependent methyltransferase